VAVKNPDGGFTWREVTLGLSNDKVIEVKKGIESGEVVFRDPLPLLTAEERARIPAPAQPAAPSDPERATRQPRGSRDAAKTNDDRINSRRP
jgi:hypothetical protein